MKEISKYYLKAKAKDVPPDTIVYKETPDPRSRQRLIPYTLTNKVVFYDDGNREVVQEAKKMLYLIDANGKISFIPPEYYVSIPFESLKELKAFVENL